MSQCENLGCTHEAEVEIVQGADVSMTSTSTQSERKIKLCVPCAAERERMQHLGGRPEMNPLG